MAEDAPRRQPTLDEVAERARCLPPVASRALNNAPHVSRAKREAVERAVRQLGYVPNPTARALATRQTGAAALVVSGEDPSIFADPFFAQVIVGASAALEEADLHLMLCLAASDRGRKRVEELLRSKGADGVMLMALREDDPLGRMAAEAQMPVVFGGRPVGPAPRWCVRRQRRRSARGDRAPGLARPEARGRDLRASGHRGRTRPVPRLPGRHAGRRSRSAPPREGTSPSPAEPPPWPHCWPTIPTWTGCSPPTTTWRRERCGTLREGRRDPADVAVVGFDDLTVAQIADPPLTTVHQPIEAFGREMARMLVALVNGQDPTPLILPTRLVIRSSA
ncbi:HTH-type transcriptional regulator OS=Streptomyces glaucescens OX=1907 GN=SGLAU_30530 PE=4 SV=1 [Streptomyces glaucescens]